MSNYERKRLRVKIIFISKELRNGETFLLADEEVFLNIPSRSVLSDSSEILVSADQRYYDKNSNFGIS